MFKNEVEGECVHPLMVTKILMELWIIPILYWSVGGWPPLLLPLLLSILSTEFLGCVSVSRGRFFFHWCVYARRCWYGFIDLYDRKFRCVRIALKACNYANIFLYHSYYIKSFLKDSRCKDVYFFNSNWSIYYWNNCLPLIKC